MDYPVDVSSAIDSGLAGIAAPVGRPCDDCGAAIGGKCYVRAEIQPVTTELVADGIWLNQVEIIGVGVVLPQHAHNWDHVSYVVRGIVRVERDDMDPREYAAPAAIEIPALVKHLFVTLTENVIVLCIHRIDRTGAVEIADEHQIVE